MTFALHLLHTQADLPKSAQSLIQDTTDMLSRLSAAVTRMLLENGTLTGSASEG